MMKPLAAIAAAVTLLSMPIHAQPTATSVEVAKLIPGQPPADFEAARTGQGAPARWRVVDDPTAQGGRAIAQTSQDSTEYRFPLTIFKPVTAKDVAVTVRFKPVSGKIDQAGGIAVRLTSPNDYYVVRTNALENNVRFYRVVKGKREQLADAMVPVAPNQWHTLSLRAEGATFAVSFDGKPLYTVQDRTFSAAGRIALWTKADSVTRFDSLTVTPRP